MYRFTGLVVLCSFLLGNLGCAAYVALKMPGPADDEQVELGMNRRDVDSVLNVVPASTYDQNGSTIATYQYADGPHPASKTRALVYVAGDIFLVFLTELIFWPIELYAETRIKRVATATYDTENSLTEFTVARTDGEVLIQLPGEPGETELLVAAADGAVADEATAAGDESAVGTTLEFEAAEPEAQPGPSAPEATGAVALD